jgi:hypothetical protein
MQSIAKLSEFADRLQCLIRATSRGETLWTDESFGELASTLFELQLELNGPYRTLCLAGRMAGDLKPQDWKEIPAVPASAFKDLGLSSLPTNDRTTVFHSSGTTKHRPSCHFHNAESLALYEESLLAFFCTQLQISQRIPILSLTPPPELARHSSLVHMFETLRRKFGGDRSVFVGYIGEDQGWTLDFEAAVESLRQYTEMGQPILILGTAFLHVHLLDYLTGLGINFKLPDGSRVMETGGYKGRSRSVPKDQLHQLICERFGILASDILYEYGMSELSSQAYSRSFFPSTLYTRDSANSTASGDSHFHFPPWARAQIISPETGREVREGETGLIRVFDLANVFSVMAIQTEDLGIRRGNGFELVGRASLAEARGCSLMAL